MIEVEKEGVLVGDCGPLSESTTGHSVSTIYYLLSQ
jgi:hypothetical protein